MDADKTTFVLSPEQWERFLKLLDEPARPMPQLVKLFRESPMFGDRLQDEDDEGPFSLGST